jgi:hypothetical protein
VLILKAQNSASLRQTERLIFKMNAQDLIQQVVEGTDPKEVLVEGPRFGEIDKIDPTPAMKLLIGPVKTTERINALFRGEISREEYKATRANREDILMQKRRSIGKLGKISGEQALEHALSGVRTHKWSQVSQTSAGREMECSVCFIHKTVSAKGNKLDR